MDEYRLVRVVWKDIQGLEGAWTSLEEIQEMAPVSIETLGWIIKEDEEHLTMVSSLAFDQTFAGSVTSIPKGCIEDIRLVTVCQECFGEKI
jgi:hypothetical protein